MNTYRNACVCGPRGGKCLWYAGPRIDSKSRFARRERRKEVVVLQYNILLYKCAFLDVKVPYTVYGSGRMMINISYDANARVPMRRRELSSCGYTTHTPTTTDAEIVKKTIINIFLSPRISICFLLLSHELRFFTIKNRISHKTVTDAIATDGGGGGAIRVRRLRVPHSHESSTRRRRRRQNGWWAGPRALPRFRPSTAAAGGREGSGRKT